MESFKLSKEFIQTIQSTFKADGERFIQSLPGLIEDASMRWDLTNIHCVPSLSFNFVAFARQKDKDVILKLGVPRAELTSEIASLKFFNGNGACKLIASDEEQGMLLLERLKPGRMLSELKDDDQRTQIAMDVLQALRGVAKNADLRAPNKLIKLSDWFDGLKKARQRFNGGTGIFPKQLFERVEAGLPELFKDKNILLHGDFHHDNILSSERGWLIIDPKGVIGPAGYEIGPLLLNPMAHSMDRASFKVRARRRINLIKERTGWEREKILQWALSHAILSAWWSFEDGFPTDFPLAAANLFFELK
ncbi:MAG: phosphotransferase [Anaerolineales bacterium]|nr:phosphotransferase [Anaerolineales bacterium]